MDPDLELRERGAGFVLLALLAFLPPVFFLFLPRIRGRGLGPLDPFPRSAIAEG